VVGPPVARWASSHGLSYLVEPTRRCERSLALGLYAFRTLRPYGRFASGEAPCHQDAAVCSRSPTTCAVGCTIPSLSRALRAFARRGVLRAFGSFRLPYASELYLAFNISSSFASTSALL